MSKIADIIRAVLKCFNPSIDVEELRRPVPVIMRKDELKAISDCHKVLIKCVSFAKMQMMGKGFI